MGDLLKLAERVEAASGPDRELFCAIAIASGLIPDNAWPHSDGTHWWANGKEWGRIPDYFASLDAAMSLVPEGWTVANIGQGDNKRWHVELRRGYRTSYGAVIIAPGANESYKLNGAPSPALALTAACLKARATLSPDGGGL